MNYTLASASKKDIDLIKKYKLETIMKYAVNISKKESDDIYNYVDNYVNECYKEYKLILINDKIIGCLLLVNYNYGILIDEIYIKEEYRNNKIGSSILEDVIANNSNIYLWVYKDNVKAITLYKRLGFNIKKETKTRYFMEIINN